MSEMENAGAAEAECFSEARLAPGGNIVRSYVPRRSTRGIIAAPIALMMCLAGCESQSDPNTEPTNEAETEVINLQRHALPFDDLMLKNLSGKADSGKSPETIAQCLTRFSKAWLWSEEPGLDVKACPPEVQNAYYDWSLTQEESIRVNAELNRIENEGGDVKAAQSAVYKARNSQSDAEKALKDMLKAMGYSNAGNPDEYAN